MSFNLTITDKPTHVVVWTDSTNVSDLVQTLTERVACLEEVVSKLVNTGLLSGIEMRRREDSISLVQESDSKDIFKELIEKHVPVEVAAEGTKDEAEGTEADVEEAAAEGTDVEDVEVDANQDEEDEDEDEDEDAALELEEFEYKGVTYYKDTDNQVYQVGEDGDLDDTAIGVWNEEKQKVLKYAKA
jgi:hypothetical protein